MKNEARTETRTTDTVTISRAEYEALTAQKAQLEELTQQVNWLMEQLRLSKKKVYGSSSERTSDELEGQMRLVFNEAEALAPTEEPAKETTVAAHTRKAKTSRAVETLPENVPVEVVEHRLSEEERVCPKCGAVMEEIGKEVHRSLKIIPAQVTVREDIYYTYACRQCKQEDIEVPVVKAPREPVVIPGSFASPEAIAYLMTQKFVMFSPLYRLEQEMTRKGVSLSRQTMSNWLLRSAEDWMKPVYDALHRELVKKDVLHADETTLQVLREPGKAAQAKSYMWLYRTGGDAVHPIVLYEYRPNRKAENAREFLSGFTGYLHADGYYGYHNLPSGIRVVGCWAHARRKFDEAIKALPKDKQAGSTAVEGQAYCNKLFDIEREIAALPYEERKQQRQERAKPILDALLAWAETRHAPAKSSLGTALHYIREQWSYLIRYTEDGRLEISNNRAERSIKPFVMGRKNFLFANTPRGAQDSAIIYSLIETAKENGLDPYRYLLYILKNAPVLSQRDNGWAEELLPENVPEEYK